MEREDSDDIPVAYDEIQKTDLLELNSVNYRNESQLSKPFKIKHFKPFPNYSYLTLEIQMSGLMSSDHIFL